MPAALASIAIQDGTKCVQKKEEIKIKAIIRKSIEIALIQLAPRLDATSVC